MGDSRIKAKIENISLLKLKVIFSEIFFMEFTVGIYTWRYVHGCAHRKRHLGDRGEQFVLDDGHLLSTTVDTTKDFWW